MNINTPTCLPKAQAKAGILLHEKAIILETNQVFAQMLGYKVTELIGMNIIRLLAPAYRILFANNIALESQKPYQAIFLRKNGSICPVECHDKTILYQEKKFRVSVVRCLGTH